ncbi:unnamed protein product [Parnassius apollo]|uniref:(apollo) hypothetical protein n=1 Tax=Parnassius apollo TaxID=110799 RepID=A0A8S3W3I6_PARAO|nr:unnamed protein product [Parnassius apollo]
MLLVRSPNSDEVTCRSNVICSELRCNKCKVIINELLAFVSNKVDTLQETGIIQICMSAYSADEIENARSVAYKLLAPTKMYMRRKEGAEQKSIQDIIKLIKEFDPDCLPIFAATNLNKLSAVSFDHVDVTTFFKEMTLLKRDVACLKAEQPVISNEVKLSEDIDLIRKEIDDVKKIMLEFRHGSSKRQDDLFLGSYHNDKNTSNKLNNSYENTNNLNGGIVEIDIDMPRTDVNKPSEGESTCTSSLSLLRIRRCR